MKRISALKIMVSTLLITCCTTAHGVIADGIAIVRVVVTVWDGDTHEPLDEATVTLTDDGRDLVAAYPDLKRYAKFFAPGKSNALGDFIVYYFGGMSISDKGQWQGVRGRLKVSKLGYTDYEADLSKLLGPSIKTDEARIPTVQVVLKRKK